MPVFPSPDFCTWLRPRFALVSFTGCCVDEVCEGRDFDLVAKVRPASWRRRGSCRKPRWASYRAPSRSCPPCRRIVRARVGAACVAGGAVWPWLRVHSSGGSNALALLLIRDASERDSAASRRLAQGGAIVTRTPTAGRFSAGCARFVADEHRLPCVFERLLSSSAPLGFGYGAELVRLGHVLCMNKTLRRPHSDKAEPPPRVEDDTEDEGPVANPHLLAAQPLSEEEIRQFETHPRVR